MPSPGQITVRHGAGVVDEDSSESGGKVVPVTFGIMDALKAEITLKRKTVELSSSSRPSKYMRRADLEKLKEEEERRAREEKELAAQEAKGKVNATTKVDEKSVSRSKSVTPLQDVRESDSPKPESSFNISNEETIRRLRAKGQPIRLFGESDKDRRLRLRALELLEGKDHERQSGQNDFKKALEDVENVERELRNKSKGKKRGDTESGSGGVIDLELVKTDPDKLYPLIYYALKRTLKEWEEAMDERPEHVKRSTQGKLAAAIQVQSAEYLKPLFKTLRSRSLPSDMLARIAEIVHYMQKREYQKANDSLLTFSQTKYPPDDVSQLMG
ncbi:hypothetical protein ID866_2725 [Astraeus odoratus]|nr:hypothetical protein ID866_2725 [Astraeus odoratus]